MFPRLVQGLVLYFTLAAVPLTAADDLRYSLRGNRYEGHRDLPISSAPALEVLSFVRGAPQLAASPDGQIRLRFFLPMQDVVHIEAREYIAHRFYEMRPLQTQWARGWNRFEPWSTRDVIAKLGVQRDNVAILARLSLSDAADGLVPIVADESLPESMRWTYHLVFRTRHDLRKADWTLRADAGSTVIRHGSLRTVQGGAPATIRFDLKDAADGYYRLLIDCRYENQAGGPEREYRFYHLQSPPPREGAGG